MTTPALKLGAVFLVDFPEHDPQGHEQEGLRPAVLVGLPTYAGPPRYPVLLLAPITTFKQRKLGSTPHQSYTPFYPRILAD